MDYQNTTLVAYASETRKAEFYKKTYLHVALAVLAFMVVETILLNIIKPEDMIGVVGGMQYAWLLVLGLFWLGTTIASKMAFAVSRTQQYIGLGLYILIEALIFVPLIMIAVYNTGGTEVITQAAVITLFMFAGLTAIVFTTKADFSFLRSGLIIGGCIAMGLIFVGIFFGGFNLGLWFSVGMVILASGSILYQTGQIKDKYHTEQYVGAALQLFSSIMLLFWYVIRILSDRR